MKTREFRISGLAAPEWIVPAPNKTGRDPAAHLQGFHVAPRSPAAIITSTVRLSSSSGDIKQAENRFVGGQTAGNSHDFPIKVTKRIFLGETISMNPVSRSASFASLAVKSDADTESTESCSEEEGQAATQQGEAISQLARALMAWHPSLIGPDVAACAVHPAARKFAVFLSQLEIEARPRLDLRREVMAWLQSFRGDAGRQQRVLDTVGRGGDAMPAMALYRLLRQAD